MNKTLKRETESILKDLGNIHLALLMHINNLWFKGEHLAARYLITAANRVDKAMEQLEVINLEGWESKE